MTLLVFQQSEAISHVSVRNWTPQRSDLPPRSTLCNHVQPPLQPTESDSGNRSTLTRKPRHHVIISPEERAEQRPPPPKRPTSPRCESAARVVSGRQLWIPVTRTVHDRFQNPRAWTLCLDYGHSLDPPSPSPTVTVIVTNGVTCRANLGHGFAVSLWGTAGCDPPLQAMFVRGPSGGAARGRAPTEVVARGRGLALTAEGCGSGASSKSLSETKDMGFSVGPREWRTIR